MRGGPGARAGAMNRQPEPEQSAEPQPGMGRVVGFPMRLSMLTIYSDDPAIKSAGPEIKKTFLAKYAP